MSKSVFSIVVVVCVATAACGTAGGDADAADITMDAAAPTVVGSQAVPSFQAEMSGAIRRSLAGSAIAGSRYGRYHINMSSRAPEGAQEPHPVVVLAFGRTDASVPAPGTYALGGREGFSGTVEVYGSPQREFDITGGSLVITTVEGDVVSGSFSVTAVERAEEFDSPTAEVRVEGTFRTRPPD
jgi:hypothetical protein